MIAKKIPKQADVGDDFERLALYIAAADQPGEKLRDFWIGNSDAGAGIEDLETALADIEAVRMMKPEAKEKTYHMIVSFRPGEQDKLTGEDLRKIAAGYVEALGFDRHQYVAGAHQNTDHFHIHIAINRVNPETLKIHAPFKDFEAMEKVSRRFEKEYGLSVDRGMSDREGDKNALSPEARDFERHTWQQSFQRFMIERKPEIAAAVEKSKTWRQVHKELAEWNIGIKPRGNGLVFHDLDGKETMKASALGREFSKKALEGRLGPYRGPQRDRPQSRGRDGKRPRYERPPLFRHPYMGPLWRQYLTTQRSPWTRSTLLGRVAGNWKLYLMSGAYQDPLAMVLVIAYMESLRIVFGDGERPRQGPNQAPNPVPRLIEPALRGLTAGREWIKVPSTVAVEARRSPGSMVDAMGNAVVMARNAEAEVVGLLVVNKEGRAVALGPDDVTRKMVRGMSRGRENGPGLA